MMNSPLGISCSPRKGGNTEILLREALASAKTCGAETELLVLYDKNLQFCDGCYTCSETGKCHIKDDMSEIHLKLLEADGIIFGSPVYFYNVTAQAKTLIDRSFVLVSDCKLTDKIGGIISVASSMGHLGVWNLFETFFNTHHMKAADLVYGYARGKGDIIKDKHAMKAAGELGRQIVLMQEAQLRHPKEYDIPIYRIVKRKYGINNCPADGRFEN